MLALDFINVGNGDSILIRELNGGRQTFAMMVDFGHDCLVRDDHPGELDPRSQRIYAGDFLRELGVTHLDVALATHFHRDHNAAQFVQSSDDTHCSHCAVPPFLFLSRIRSDYIFIIAFCLTLSSSLCKIRKSFPYSATEDVREGYTMVMGWIWTGMVLLALGAAVLTGQTGALTAAALEGAASAIRLALGLAGALCLWSGAAKALERAGGMRALARLARPVFRRLFPQTAQDETAMGYLTANVAANLLGLGNAATPMGIAAVRRMQQRSGSARATDEMCRLIVLNTASIQLLPTTVAAVRAANGAAAPFDILPAVWLTSVCSVTAGLLAAFLFGRASRA